MGVARLSFGARRAGASCAFVLFASAALAATPAEQNVHVITIEGMQFSPASLTVRRGDRVKWVNKDLFPHTATASDGTFDSASVAPNASWTLVAQRGGTFSYACAFHPAMKGILTVR
jgi:plastocyanin